VVAVQRPGGGRGERCPAVKAARSAPEAWPCDPLRVKGFFREWRYDRDGETVTARIFIVKDLAVERQEKPRTEIETGAE
jgi:hypothetical protein